jgi:predicted peroxiredoxin
MKKFFSIIVLVGVLFSQSIAEDKMVKGLNVIVTAADAQAQMMAMVLSLKTLSLGKKVNIVLCSAAGDLAVKGMKSALIKPMNKSPKMFLKALIKKDAKVELCPLYLPNANKDKSVLLKGINIAVPIEGAKDLLNKDYRVLSY